MNPDQDNLDQQQEYETRKIYIVTDYKGTMHTPAHINFHPNQFYGTQKEYDDIYNKYLKGHDDEFKVIGERHYANYEDILIDKQI